MKRLLDTASRVGASDVNILISGETGVGKERLARYIHYQSQRASGPFVPINCGAVPEQLFESELFGHVRGAFTGATQERIGLVEAADRGTLLLDEIGELQDSLQVKLLRAIQDREIRRVGDNRCRNINIRFISATNRDLRAAADINRFRMDLFYRLAVIELRIPPLRERPDDIRPLAEYVLRHTARALGHTILAFSDAALERLVNYSWPGNVRELENAVQYACVLTRDRMIRPSDLPDWLDRAPTGKSQLGIKSLAEVERDYIYDILARNNGNKATTARQLGIGAATLYRRLNSYRSFPGKSPRITLRVAAASVTTSP